MELSDSLISQFVSTTNDRSRAHRETTVFGTIVTQGDLKFVRIDGSTELTPAVTTVEVSDGERVSVLLKNHSATIVGNLTSPAAKSDSIGDISHGMGEIIQAINEKASQKDFAALVDRVTTLETDVQSLKERMNVYDSDCLTLEKAQTLFASISSLTAVQNSKLDASVAEALYAKLEEFSQLVNRVDRIESQLGSST